MRFVLPRRSSLRKGHIRRASRVFNKEMPPALRCPRRKRCFPVAASGDFRQRPFPAPRRLRRSDLLRHRFNQVHALFRRHEVFAAAPHVAHVDQPLDDGRRASPACPARNPSSAREFLRPQSAALRAPCPAGCSRRYIPSAAWSGRASPVASLAEPLVARRPAPAAAARRHPPSFCVVRRSSPP